MMKIFKNIFPEKVKLTPFKSLVFWNKSLKVFWYFIMLESFTETLNLRILWLKTWMMEQLKPSLLTLVNLLMYHSVSRTIKYWDSQLSMPPYNVLTLAKKVSIQKKLIYGLLVLLYTNSQQIECQLHTLNVLRAISDMSGQLH